MATPSEKRSIDVSISHQALPDQVHRNRAAFRAENERLEEVVRPRIEAQLQACRLALEQLKEWHRYIPDRTDLDLTGYSRGSALWLVSGRSLGLLQALMVLAEAGIDSETMVMGRALHEANRMLLVFSLIGEENLVRTWLDDEGKHGYVRPKASRDAQNRFEDQLDEAMQQQGMALHARTEPLVEELYDRMSRVAHTRRSTCVSSVSEPLREFFYGRHESPIRRGIVVEWTSSVAVEVVLAVGDALRAFYGEEWFMGKIPPLRDSIEAVRRTCPLTEDSIVAAADSD